MKCNSCRHYGFYQMIQAPYGYRGEIPCLTCSRFSPTTDNFEPINSLKIVDTYTTSTAEFTQDVIGDGVKNCGN